MGYTNNVMLTQRDRKHPKKKEDRTSKGQVVIPYVKGISEAVSRVLRKHDIDTAMRPVCTLKDKLVHPKDKVEIWEKGGCV